MIQHEILYFGQTCVSACDAKCSKAWGINARPRIPTPGATDEDDFAWAADGELGEAPADPGTYEGGHPKPSATDGGPADGRHNKWCVRECERSEIFEPGEAVVVRDFSKRRPN